MNTFFNTLKQLALVFTLCLIGAGSTSFAEDDAKTVKTKKTDAESYEFSQAELDQILAPIALYPDTILSHILIASTYPLEIIQAERWARENKELKGDKALEAVETKDWDASVKALVPFPNILEKMSEDLEWMQKLGDAFLQDEKLVLTSIQALRARAYEEGNLDDLDHLEVSKDDDHIVIEPKVEKVVYVPYYDTRLVYGPWWWNDYPPTYWAHHHHHYSGPRFYWGAGAYVGTGIYFSAFHWHNRHVVVVNRHHHHRHRFHSGRYLSRHVDSRRWRHNPQHRRGVKYRSPRLRPYHERHGRRVDTSRHRNTRHHHSSNHLTATAVEQRLRQHPTSTRQRGSAHRQNSRNGEFKSRERRSREQGQARSHTQQRGSANARPSRERSVTNSQQRRADRTKESAVDRSQRTRQYTKQPHATSGQNSNTARWNSGKTVKQSRSHRSHHSTDNQTTNKQATSRSTNRNNGSFRSSPSSRNSAARSNRSSRSSSRAATSSSRERSSRRSNHRRARDR